MNVLFQPHSDDAVLFASFTCIQYQPKVVTVLRSVKQDSMGISHEERVAEDEAAMAVLGCELEQWPEPDTNPDWEAVERMMTHFAETQPVNMVFAPAIEEQGHEQHNMVGELAEQIFTGRGQLVHYMTYKRGYGRSMGHEVPFEPEWVPLKYKALGCYLSQIRERSTRTWFVDEPIREYRF